ncbi:histidine phosphatase family protein [bacterium]|nr:histidine phosphatase family protein [bacterium]
MTTRVFLVRHGSTVLSVEDRFAGRTNAALSDQGREQAHSLAHRLSKESIEAFYASPLDRTLETASILAKSHGKKAQPESAFREIDHGVWEGLTRYEAESKYAEMYSRWEEDPFNYAPEGGESGLSVTARAMPTLLSLVEKHAGQMICIVSHKATIRLLLSAVLGFDPRTRCSIVPRS